VTVLRTVVWLVGGIVALDITLVAMIALYAVIDRGRSRRQIRDLEEIWDLEPRASLGARGGFTWPLGGRLTAAIALAAVVCAGTAVASPDARHMVASVFGSVARQLGIGGRDVPEEAERIGGAADAPLGAGAAPGRSVPGAAGSAGGSSRAAHGGAHTSTGTPSGSTAEPSVGPSTPTAVTAAPSSSTQIDVAWADVSGEMGYRLERSPDGVVGWATVTTTGSDATFYHDAGLASSTTYFYRVFATDLTGDSAPSGVVSATTSPDPPSQPTIVTLTATSTDVDIIWTDVAAETGYRVERSPDGAIWTTIATTGQDVTAYHDGGLIPATTYVYRVVASNAGGDSPPSDPAQVVTSASSPADVEPSPTA
jgi:Fibronectin type III domain